MTNPNQDAAALAFENLSHVALHRASLASLLANGFADPTLELVNNLLNGELHGEAKASVAWLGVDSGHFAAALGALEHFAAEYADSDPESLLHDLKVEYARLFIGPPTAAVPPYESLYLDPLDDNGQRLLMGASARAVQKAYDEAGLHMVAELREPPDHISAEFEFFYYLCKKESETWQREANDESKKWRRRERAFAEEHLGKWGVTFCRQVAEKSQSGFYTSLASLAAIFIQIENGAFRPA